MTDFGGAVPSSGMPTAMQPEVLKFLEAVFAVAPHPEEYVKYRLHLATALSIEALDAWFELRRASVKEQDQQLVQRPKAISAVSTMGQEDTASQRAQVPAFSLFGEAAPPLKSMSYEQRSLALLASTTKEVQDVGRLLTMMQNSTWDPARPSSEGISNALETCRATEATASDQTREIPRSRGGLHGEEGLDVSNLAVRSGKGEGDAVPSNRFTEADLGVISQLVGLETINSRDTHCGSHSLYMFEQLTALDSLDFDSTGGSKRKRTRHQHFWRNTDKLDPRDRVYVPTASLQPALRNEHPVIPKREISPDERTNSWTVCLTTSGVIGYLNKRISPLGVQMIRALAGNCKVQRQGPAGIKPQLPLKPEALRHNTNGSGFRRIAPKPPAEQQDAGPLKRTRSLSTSDGVSISDGGRSPEKGAEEHTYGFTPVPRTRRRKPS